MGDAPTSTQLSDDELISGIVGGHAWAADALYDQMYPAVDRALCRVLGSRSQEYDDLIQATFERLIVSIAAGQFARKCSLRTWAAAIASNQAIDALRARSRQRKLFEAEAEPHFETSAKQGQHGGEQRVEAHAAFGQIQRVLAQMDPEKVKILVLHHVLGHDLAEIAAMFGISAAACQSRLVRGRKEFLERMEKGVSRNERR